MITFLVVAVVATVLIKVINRVYYKTLYRQMSYSAYMNLHKDIGDIISNPPAVHNMCYIECAKIAQNLNLIGEYDCTTEATVTEINNGTAVPSFITSNGLRFYNFATIPQHHPYRVS